MKRSCRVDTTTVRRSQNGVTGRPRCASVSPCGDDQCA